MASAKIRSAPPGFPPGLGTSPKSGGKRLPHEMEQYIAQYLDPYEQKCSEIVGTRCKVFSKNTFTNLETNEKVNCKKYCLKHCNDTQLIPLFTSNSPSVVLSYRGVSIRPSVIYAEWIVFLESEPFVPMVKYFNEGNFMLRNNDGTITHDNENTISIDLKTKMLCDFFARNSNDDILFRAIIRCSVNPAYYKSLNLDDDILLYEIMHNDANKMIIEQINPPYIRPLKDWKISTVFEKSGLLTIILVSEFLLS